MARGKQRCAYFQQYSDGYLWSCRFSNEIYTVLKDVDKVLIDHFVRCTVRVRVLQFGLVSVSINILVLSASPYAASILYLQSQLPSLAAARRIILLARGSDSVFCPRSSKSQVSSARHIFTLASSTNLLTFTGPKVLLKPHFTQENWFRKVNGYSFQIHLNRTDLVAQNF